MTPFFDLVWRDDAQGGRLVWDKPVLIQCFTSIDRDYYEYEFPLEGG